VACSAEDLGERSEVHGYSKSQQDSVDLPPIPMVWEDSVVLADLWLQGVATWSFAPLPWAMYGHGLAHRHHRPCLKSRFKHIFSLHLESTQSRRAHGVFIVLALGIRLYYSIKISSSSPFKTAASRASVYLEYPHSVTFEVVIEELKQWQCSLWLTREVRKITYRLFGRWRLRKCHSRSPNREQGHELESPWDSSISG
jgi:hypothetical protein